MNHVWGLFWVKKWRPSKNAVVQPGISAGIPLTMKLMDPAGKKTPWMATAGFSVAPYSWHFGPKRICKWGFLEQTSYTYY
jgi:hypothetical protein